MSTSLALCSFPDQLGLATSLAEALNATPLKYLHHRFPDGESLFRFARASVPETVVLVTDLSAPDPKFLQLALLSATLRDLGCRHLLLVAPYLPYMRQDKVFTAGEGITARYFAQLLSRCADTLITVDPHLHRIHDLNEVYAIPAVSLAAAPLLAHWIQREVPRPLLIGPDEESEQWVKAVAQRAGAPWQVLTKRRHGDYRVEVSTPDWQHWQGHTPVLVDDIISSGHTMLEAALQLREQQAPAPVCIAVHPVFSGGGSDRLAATAARLVSCNSIPHPTNAIDLTPLLAESLRPLINAFPTT